MKKIFQYLLRVGFIAMIAVTYLSFNLDRNVELRHWLRDHFQREEKTPVTAGIFFLGTNSIHFLEGKVEDPYVDPEWLKDINATYTIDKTENILSIIWTGQWIEIDRTGAYKENQEKREGKIRWGYQDGQVLIAVQDLNQVEGFKAMGLRTITSEDGSQFIIQSETIDYKQTKVLNKTYLFSSLDQLRRAGDLDSAPTIKAIFKTLELGDEIKKRDNVVAYPIGDDTAMIYNGRYVGYACTESLESLYEGYVFLEDREDLYEKENPYDTPIFLVWEAVYAKNPKTENITGLNGVNVISPTWVELTSDMGEYTQKISKDYINWNKQNNRDLWLLATNSFDPDLTQKFLQSIEGRKKFIEALIGLCLEHKIEGINIDFENVYMEDKDRLTHFVNELAWYCHKFDLTLSMDVTVMGGSDNWSKCYDREMLGKIVDYLIVMTYDEYWASSPISGPVSSLDWVETNIMKISEIVPSRKLILGLPFYTRVWTETISEQDANSVSVSSKAISLSAQNDLIEEKGLTPIWNEQDGLFFVSYIEENSIKKIWVENETTLALKAGLVNKLNLKGIAGWRRGLETPSVYPALEQQLR